MVKNISILGSTGSIGTQALDVSRKLNLNISAITAYSNIDILEQQVREFKPSLAVVFAKIRQKNLKQKLPILIQKSFRVLMDLLKQLQFLQQI